MEKLKQLKNWLDNNPKQTLSIMGGLIIISIIGSLLTYQSLGKQAKTIDLVRHYKNTLNSTKEVGNDVVRLSKIKVELDAFRTKDVLSPQDSLRINYLIKQLNEKN